MSYGAEMSAKGMGPNTCEVSRLKRAEIVPTSGSLHVGYPRGFRWVSVDSHLLTTAYLGALDRRAEL